MKACLSDYDQLHISFVSFPEICFDIKLPCTIHEGKRQSMGTSPQIVNPQLCTERPQLHALTALHIAYKAGWAPELI
jgi:hypothetical protein